jgi:CRP/FNR family cyclic AMP-dependent transcriptional regulator
MPAVPPVPGTFLASLDQAERDALTELGLRRSFPRGGVVMFQQEPDDRVMVLLSGRVKVARADESGHELVLSIRDPGDVLGELAFINGEPRIATVTALEPLEALVMPANAFRTHLETTPGVAVRLLEVVAHRFRESTLRRLQFAALDTMGRLAARLVDLADRYGEAVDGGVKIASPLTQEELATWTGASRAGVSQALQAFRELGWIQTGRRHVLVRDLEALRARSK